MLLTAIVCVPLLKAIVPASVIVGVAPASYLAIVSWRAVSWFLPERFYRQGDDLLYAWYQRVIEFFFENVTGLEVRLYGDYDKISKDENAIIICNHQCLVDWLVIDMVAIRYGTLGRIRYVLKDSLKWLPLYGWYFHQHAGIYIKRNKKFVSSKMTEKLHYLTKYNVPYWLVIFPEGTRYDPTHSSLIKKSQAFALEQGLPVLKQVLSPRSKATYASLKKLKGSLNAVYDVTIAYSDDNSELRPQTVGNRQPAPGFIDMAMGKCSNVNIHIRKVNLEEIPSGEMQCQRWLHECFEEKDIMLEDFYFGDEKTRGRLHGVCKKSKLSIWSTLPSLTLMSALTLPLLVSEQGRQIYWKTWVVGTLLSYSFVCVATR